MIVNRPLCSLFARYPRGTPVYVQHKKWGYRKQKVKSKVSEWLVSHRRSAYVIFFSTLPFQWHVRFLVTDGVSGGRFVPIVSPATLLLSSRGRVTLSLSRITPRAAPGYAAPEYQHQQQGTTTTTYTDTDIEKARVVHMCIFILNVRLQVLTRILFI